MPPFGSGAAAAAREVTSGERLTFNGAHSSVSPSQSLSRPSQVSGLGLTEPSQGPQKTPVQLWLPGRHSPTEEPQVRLSPEVQRSSGTHSPALQR